jgi:hypothetical protein
MSARIEAVLSETVEAQRKRIFLAMGILSCIARTQDRAGIPIGAPDYASACEAAENLLDEAAGELGIVADELNTQALEEEAGAEEVQS